MVSKNDRIATGRRSPIVPAYTIYVDEAGTPNFRPSRDSTLPAYVTCAVVVPTLREAEARALLPRDATHRLLKSSDRAMSTDIGLGAMRRLLQLDDIDVSVVTVSPSESKSVDTVAVRTNSKNKDRAAQHRTHMSPAAMGYAMLTSMAITEAWKKAVLRRVISISYVNIVFHTMSLAREDKAEVADHYLLMDSRSDVLRVADVQWKSVDAEPLLVWPDLVAGSFHRYALYQDNTAVQRFLLQQSKSGRLAWKDAPKFGRQATAPAD